MKFFSALKPNYAIAVGAGLLLGAAFPGLGMAGLAWVAPGLLLFAGMGQGSAERFRIGYAAGLANHLLSLYWLLFIPFPAGAVAGWLALSAYLALYPAMWVWLCWKLYPANFVAASASSWRSKWWSLAEQFLAVRWWQRALWMLFCAALWVALEFMRGRFLSGFPWNFLGSSQYQLIPLIQIASITGVYGVSFLMVWFSVSLSSALARLARQPQSRWGWMTELRLPLFGLVAVICFGLTRINPALSPGREVTVALVQPSIPQTLLWDRREDSNRFAKIIELSRLALAARPDLLIWPEASLPALTEENFRAIGDLVATHKIWMIFGADDAERRAEAPEPNSFDYFNAAFLFSPDGKYAGSYRKRHLVAFGEYVPLARWLPILRRWIPVPGDFQPGDGPVPFDLNLVASSDEPQEENTSDERGSQIAATAKVRLSVLICFEDVFPHLVREYVDEETDFLLNLTNNGWFGKSAAQWQHAASAVFRAVENDVPLVRCTNNGLTCWIDSHGRIRQILGMESGDVYAAGFMTGRIPLWAKGQRRTSTFYRRYGDLFGWICAGVSVISLGFRFGEKFRRSPV